MPCFGGYWWVQFSQLYLLHLAYFDDCLHSKINYVSMIRDNFGIRANQHTINAVWLIQKTGLELNNNIFGQLFLSFLSELHNWVLSSAGQNTMKQSVAFLGNFNPAHKLKDVDDIAASMPGIIERLATAANIVHSCARRLTSSTRSRHPFSRCGCT
jgi:hypothetical protein